MSTLERIGIEILGGIGALAAVLIWWHVHNLNEQHVGAQACLLSTTETKTEAIASNTALVGAQGVDLKLVVKTYEDKVNLLAADNAGLARRLHDSQVRQGPAANTGTAAAGAVCAVDVPAGQGDPGAVAIEAASKKIFDDCDADYAGRVAVIEVYNQWRDRMIAAK